jgi:hypothetical protein
MKLHVIGIMESIVPYYLLLNDEISHVWKIDSSAAERVGVTNSREGANTYLEPNSGQPIWETLACRLPVWFGPHATAGLHKLKLAPGKYYPRMARPLDQHPNESLGYCPGVKDTTNEIAMYQGQLIALTRDLQRICQTVHPTDATFTTFGHDIRNLLILACTEVEAHWRGVLIANEAAKPGQRLNTNDYVKLASPMRLPEFVISFPFFPWIKPFKPFEKWGATEEPTKEIEWYDAYNEVKHDREGNFARATLRNAFHAVSACAIMMWAQFGHPNYFGEHSELRGFFHLSSGPKWSPSELYTFPYQGHASDWVPVPFNFSHE